MGLLREQCAEWKMVRLQYCCNQIWMKNGGQIPWNAIPICETFTDLMSDGKTLIREAVWKTISRTDHSIWFIGWILPYLFEGSVKNPSIWKESLTWIVPRIRSVRGRNLEGWRTGRRPWGVGDDGRIWNLFEKTQCKGSNISQRKCKIHFPVADGRIKISGGEIRNWEHPLWYAIDQFKERVILTFLENQKGLFHNLKTRFRMPVKR